jgi:serine/threonine protein kinase/Tfp pilus assembly protein PilF
VNTKQSSPNVAQLETETDIDPELAEILDAYLTSLERGSAPSREDFLVEHPRHAADLVRYLPWIELLFQARPRDAEPAANPPMPTLLGDFRVLGEIGRGGMGIVYQAEQISLKRHVALKVLPFASMLDERQLVRFKNEALAAAQLHHPNIVPVFAVGCERGLHFYAMQLIEGQTLEHWIHDLSQRPADDAIRNSTLRLASAQTMASNSASHARFRKYAQWFIQAAEALDHAHNQGIVHRDVKPSNLMISTSGDLWVTDFGLARSQRDASMTVSGDLLGTLRYMSPEQLRSKPGIVDHRTDIYSLGLTMYELVSERPRFDGQTQHELIRQIENDEAPSLVRIDPQVPRDLDSIILKAISKNPEARYASAQDMADDLRRFLDGRPTLARPATWRDHGEKWVRRHARLAASAGLALMLVVMCAMASALVVWRAKAETQQALVLANDNHLRAEDHLQDARRAVDDVFTGVATDLAEIPGAENVRRQLLNQALTYYRKFAAGAAANPSVCAETAAAYYRCGQISEQLGDDEGALAAYQDARQCWTARKSQDALESLRPLALCENNLGLIHLRAGRHSEAETHLRSALELQRALAARRADDETAQGGLALSYSNLGMALGQCGRIDEARTCLQNALDLQATVASPSALARGDRAATCNQLGFLSSSVSRAEAEGAYRQAADEFERLAQDEPHALRWQAQLAATLNNLAALAAQADRLDDAEADYRRAVEIQRQLTARAPQVVAYLRDLAVSQNNFGYLLSRKNLADAAVEQFEGARTNLSRLARAHDKSPEYTSRLGAVCNNLGLAFENQKQNEQAQAAFGEAIEWQRKAVVLSPEWRQAQAYLDAHTANLARVLRATIQLEATDAATAEKLSQGKSPKPAAQIVQVPQEAAVPVERQAFPAGSIDRARPATPE